MKTINKLSGNILIAAVLFSAALFTGCPGPGIDPAGQNPGTVPEKPAAEEVFTPKKIVLFGTDKLYDGNLGGRTGADEKVTDDENKPAGLRDVHAFISVDEADCIKNIPERYGFSRDLPVVGPDGATLIADNWDDLLDGEIKAPLYPAGVLKPGKGGTWWSGSNMDGTASKNNCIGWTTVSDTSSGIAGYSDEKDEGRWIVFNSGIPSDCELQLVGFGISGTDVGQYIPVTGIKLDKTELYMQTGETFKLNAIIEPADATRQDVIWKIYSSTPQLCISVDSSGTVSALRTRPLSTENKVIVTISTPEGPEYTAVCTVEVMPSRIVLFSTASKYASDAAERYSSLTDMIYQDSGLPDGYSFYRPFAGYDDFGPKDFPVRFNDYRFRTDIPVTGPGPEYRLIADNWDDLLDRNIKTSLNVAGLGYLSNNEAAMYWWSGCDSSGVYQATESAAGWNKLTSSEVYARVGSFNRSDSSWIQAHLVNNDERLPFLGIAW